MTPILQADDITKVFQEGKQAVPVLNGVSLSLHQGEVVTLEGPSGSGKTTLLSILGCILTPSSGSVLIDSKPVASNNLAAIRKRHIGFVFQQFNLFPSLSALENVEYALNIRGIKGHTAHDEARRVLDAVELSDRMNFLPQDMSGGQKQRVAVARALAGRAPIILADEPTANLDSKTGLRILSMFRDLAKQEQRALLIVTHDSKVRDISDRVLRISDGKLIH